jgi:hypothetical protein
MRIIVSIAPSALLLLCTAAITASASPRPAPVALAAPAADNRDYGEHSDGTGGKGSGSGAAAEGPARPVVVRAPTGEELSVPHGGLALLSTAAWLILLGLGDMPRSAVNQFRSVAGLTPGLRAILDSLSVEQTLRYIRCFHEFERVRKDWRSLCVKERTNEHFTLRSSPPPPPALLSPSLS